MFTYLRSLIWLLLAMPVLSADPILEDSALEIGDPAPALDTGRWIKGEPIMSLTSGTVYIVEFWATWCGPCRATIPHLSAMQERFKDRGVIVIGQNCWEENPEVAEAFVKEMGDRMNYRVALDRIVDEKGVMATTWMEAAGQGGIPCAFVVDGTGRIAWIGHPQQELESVLEKVLAGTFDAAAFREEQERRMAPLMKLGAAMEEERWDDALRAIEQVEQALPDLKDDMGMARFAAYLGKKDYASMRTHAEKLAVTYAHEPMVLNEIAWILVTTEGVEKPDVELAERIAKRAVEASGRKEPAMLDTLARVLFVKGDRDAAVAAQEEAIKQVDDDLLREQLEETLKCYRAGQLPGSGDEKDGP